MIKHYLKVAFRNLMKYKPQSFVSIIGLAVGFTCFALSVLWIRYEMRLSVQTSGRMSFRRKCMLTICIIWYVEKWPKTIWLCITGC